MRGGIFNNMRPAKKVEFIERVDKTILGLDGLRIIVEADKKELQEFEKIGRKCLTEISSDYIKENYGLIEGIELGKKLHEERVLWMKRNTK